VAPPVSEASGGDASESAERRAILEALESEPASGDELGRRLGRRPDQLALDLLELELAGQVQRASDGAWRRR
jgi:predicted Rossmann fold nucleotide-binding protein DprA/Smf involved in DNA uptake